MNTIELYVENSILVIVRLYFACFLIVMMILHHCLDDIGQAFCYINHLEYIIGKDLADLLRYLYFKKTLI